jgi:starch-binding outer membrane protein, SusD/RagB family
MNMKKYIYSLCTVLCVICAAGCIEETYPSAQATPDQIKGSSSLESLTNSLPAFLVTWDTYGTSNNTQDWGYPCQMYMRETMGEDFPAYDNGYNYWTWLENAISLRYMYYYPYFYYYSFIKNANNVISQANLMDPEGNDGVRYNLGIGYGYRAMLYLDMSRQYEYRETGVTSLDSDAESKGVYGITIPIVKETTTVNELKNNPCAPFYTMYRFIMTDLNRAEECLEGYTRSSKAMMDKYVIYGLKTRLWLDIATRFDRYPNALAQQLAVEGSGDGYDDLEIRTANDCYKKVIEYAGKLMYSSPHTPLTQEEWTNPETGFNTPQASWILGTSITSKEQINYNYWNTFLGTMASEADWGMTMKSYSCYRMIGKSLYDKIGDGDWRKNSWVSPDDAGKNPAPEKYRTSVSETKWSEIPAYANLKFRPGSGSLTSLEQGLIACQPMMRVEEMYFDYFEAVAHTEGVSKAASLLQDFINTYRYTDGSYVCSASTLTDFINELMVQRRIEFWGEGVNYFDYKRLALAVTRNYDGTNYETDYRLNSFKGYVAPWMNYMIPETEKDLNPAVIIAPNPSGAISVSN